MKHLQVFDYLNLFLEAKLFLTLKIELFLSKTLKV